jgi:hypothetical protein
MGSTKVLGALLIIAISYILFAEKSCNKLPENVIKQDTLTVLHYDTVYFDTTRINYLEVPTARYVYDTTYYVDSIKVKATIYEDTIKSDSVNIYYKANISGVLNSLDLGYTLTYPIITKIETHTVTKTTQKPLRSLYLGFDVDVTRFQTYTPNVTFNADNGWSGQLGYELKNRSIVIGFKRRLF